MHSFVFCPQIRPLGGQTAIAKPFRPRIWPFGGQTGEGEGEQQKKRHPERMSLYFALSREDGCKTVAARGPVNGRS